MTMEMKIKRIMNRYDREMEELKNEYTRRIDNVYVNRFGEASAEEILEVNCWYVQQENRIRNDFVAAVLNA